MSSGQKSIIARVAVEGVRGIVVLAVALGVGYFLLSKDEAANSKAQGTNSEADRDADDEPKPAKTAVANEQETTVKLDPDGQEKGGIEIAAPKEIIYQVQARAYGTILPLDRLTSLFNSSLTAAVQLKSAQVKLEASKIANARAQNLLKVFPTAASQAEAAEAIYKLDLAGVDVAQAEIDTISNTAIQEWGSVLGQAIATRSALAEGLVHHKLCLIQLTLQPGVVVAAPARISVTLGSASTTDAELVSEATQADPKIPNASFLYTVPTIPAALAGMSVVALFPNGAAKPGVGIPPSAVIWQSGRAWMYVQDGTDRFARRAIGEEAAPTADGGYVLPAASWPHDKLIVVAGAQTLLSEEAKSQGHSEEDDN